MLLLQYNVTNKQICKYFILVEPMVKGSTYRAGVDCRKGGYFEKRQHAVYNFCYIKLDASLQ